MCMPSQVTASREKIGEFWNIPLGIGTLDNKEIHPIQAELNTQLD